MTQANSPNSSLKVDLKVLVWNVENLFLLSDQKFTPEHLKLDETQWQKLSTSIYPNKSLQKSFAISKVIAAENPDIILLCEVGGVESLNNFNQLFLENKYSPILIEGNSDRHIDLGFLVRRNLGFYFDVSTNKNRSINYLYPHERSSLEAPVTGGHKFSRDAAELHLFLQNHDNPFFIFVMTHLKSQLDRDRIDPQGFERRQAEFKTLLKIYEELRARFNQKVPIALAGDFNGNATRRQTDTEFQALYDAGAVSLGLSDVCDLAQLDAAASATYFQIQRTKTDGKQLDYCFLSPEAQAFLKRDSVKVYRYIDHMGFPLAPPANLEAKGQLPSDHYPLVFELKDIPLK